MVVVLLKCSLMQGSLENSARNRNWVSTIGVFVFAIHKSIESHTSNAPLIWLAAPQRWAIRQQPTLASDSAIASTCSIAILIASSAVFVDCNLQSIEVTIAAAVSGRSSIERSAVSKVESGTSFKIRATSTGVVIIVGHLGISRNESLDKVPDASSCLISLISSYPVYKQ